MPFLEPVAPLPEEVYPAPAPASGLVTTADQSFLGWLAGLAAGDGAILGLGQAAAGAGQTAQLLAGQAEMAEAAVYSTELASTQAGMLQSIGPTGLEGLLTSAAPAHPGLPVAVNPVNGILAYMGNVYSGFLQSVYNEMQKWFVMPPPPPPPLG